MAGLYELWRDQTRAAEDPRRWRWSDPAEPRHLLAPAAAGDLVAQPARTLVNSVANNGPELVEPLPAGDPAAGGDPASAAVADATLF